MTSNNQARPKGRDIQTEWRQARSDPEAYEEDVEDDCHEEEDESSGQRLFVRSISVAPKDAKGTHDSDDSHQKDKRVAGRKRQAIETALGDQIRQKAVKYRDPRTADVVNDANHVSVNVRPKNSDICQSGNVATPLHYGTGYVAEFSTPTNEARAVQSFIMGQASMSPEGQAVTCAAPVLDSSPAFSFRDAKGGHKTDESRVVKHMVKKGPNTSAQTPAVGRPQMSRAKSSARWDIEETGQSRGDGEGASVGPEHEASIAGPPMGSEDDRYPGWQELLDFMELGKSRLLEDEPALRFLRSLEPRIIGESYWYFEPHTLFLGLARMANVSQRRERFEEYLVEAPREWYCLTTVCKHGYESEHALASEKDCGCSQSHKTCLQARIRRGKLGAFDVRFR